MEITKLGNIKININPDRHYQGQFVGQEYYRLADVQRAFPFISDFEEIDEDGFDLGDAADNTEMIRHHCNHYRRIGYIVA